MRTAPINGSRPRDYPHRRASSRVHCIGLFGCDSIIDYFCERLDRNQKSCAAASIMTGKASSSACSCRPIANATKMAVSNSANHASAEAARLAFIWHPFHRATSHLALHFSGRTNRRCCANRTTQAQRPGARDAWIATTTLTPGSLQRMVSRQTYAKSRIHNLCPSLRSDTARTSKFAHSRSSWRPRNRNTPNHHALGRIRQDASSFLQLQCPLRKHVSRLCPCSRELTSASRSLPQRDMRFRGWQKRQQLSCSCKSKCPCWHEGRT